MNLAEMGDFKYKFIEDATDLLEQIEQTLLDLEKNKSDSALIEQVFRVMHTLKGSAAMYGFARIGKTTHGIENIYDLVRNGRIDISKPVLDLTLKAVDFLHTVLHSHDESNFANDFDTVNRLVEEVLQNAGEKFFDGNKIEIEKLAKAKDGAKTYIILIKPDEDLRNRGVKIHQIFEQFSDIGISRILHRASKQASGPGIFWEIFLSTEAPQSDIEDIIVFMEDICEIQIIAEKNLFEHDTFDKKLNDIGLAPQTDIEQLKIWIKNLDTELLENKQDEIKQNQISGQKAGTIKVAFERLDEQMLLLSELVTVNSQLQMMVEKIKNNDLKKTVEQIDKISRRFRNNIFKIRLIPLDTLQLRFERLVRDISVQLNKKIEFITEGLNTELDKTIADSLEQPIMHLIRNSLDHGIETPDIRKLRNKPAIGHIKFSAKQSSGNIFISIEDDGEGIDTQRIKEKAIERGLISNESNLSETELYNIIFAPGFSTARNLTEVSGRGVGMDVVKKTISNLRGSIDIESEKAKGTRFTIKLPLFLSIIDTMLIRAGNCYFSIPLPTVVKCHEIYESEVGKSIYNTIVIDKVLLPYIQLATAMGEIPDDKKYLYQNRIENLEVFESKKRQVALIVTVNGAETFIALIADEVIGQHQAVLKPLGDYFAYQPYIAGATQLADGKIAIVLEVERLISFFSHK